MKFWIIPGLILCISGCSRREVPQNLNNAIDSISSKWVPDKREGISDLSLVLNSDGKLILRGETNIRELKNDITAWLKNSGFDYTDSLMVLPDPAEIDKPWGLVSVGVCNIKGDPSHSAELTSQAVMGTPVKIFKKKGGWLLIQTPDYYIGWTSDSGIEELTDEQIKRWKQSDRIIYKGKTGDILDETGKNVVSDIVSGAILVRTGEKGDHYTVSLPDGRKGCIPGKDAAGFNAWSSAIKPEAKNLIRFARTLTGYPYLWGGTSAKAVDCSGFTRTVYFTAGIILARDASLQFLHGIQIDISLSFDSLHPGDLLYFGHVNAAGIKRITHTGMYIGDTEVIHSSGMVRINSLDSTRSNYSLYLKKSIMGARRIIGAVPEKGTESVTLNSWYADQK